MIFASIHYKTRDINIVFAKLVFGCWKLVLHRFSVLLNFRGTKFGEAKYPNNISHTKFVSCQKLAVDQITNFPMGYPSLKKSQSNFYLLLLYPTVYLCVEFLVHIILP